MMKKIKNFLQIIDLIILVISVYFIAIPILLVIAIIRPVITFIENVLEQYIRLVKEKGRKI
jgi:hypothetical protein